MNFYPHPMRQYCFMLTACFIGAMATAHGQAPEEQDKWANYSIASNDATKLHYLKAICAYYKTYSNSRKCDSTASIALQLAHGESAHEQRMKAYELYFEYSSPTALSHAAADARELMQLASECNDNECLAHAHAAKAAVYAGTGDNSQALDERKDAYISASRLKADAPLRVQTQLALGDAFSTGNQKLEAYRNYLEALQAAENSGNENLKYDCYDHLAGFFLLTEGF